MLHSASAQQTDLLIAESRACCGTQEAYVATRDGWESEQLRHLAAFTFNVPVHAPERAAEASFLVTAQKIASSQLGIRSKRSMVIAAATKCG